MSEIGQAVTLTNGCAKSLENKVDKVFEVFEETFSRFEPNRVFLSFNGGKDCTVLLHLVKTFLSKNENLPCENLRVFYIQPEKSFEEVERFVESCDKFYNVKIEKVRGRLKGVIDQVCKENSELKAVVMGCRRTDPHCGDLQVFQPTDPGWPPLLRVNPLLEWTCKDIWDYIQHNNIPYCSLYNDGYTSLGDRTNTERNPYLRVTIDGMVSYRPAYELTDDLQERAGRH